MLCLFCDCLVFNSLSGALGRLCFLVLIFPGIPMVSSFIRLSPSYVYGSFITQSIILIFSTMN